jgi:hypothetical protein
MNANIGEILANGQIYLLLYIFFALTMLIEGFYENVTVSRWMARGSALILILFIGLRWDTGTDWRAYLNIFYATPSNPDYDIIVFGVDPGYVFLNHLVYRFFDDYSVFLMLDALVAIAAVYIFIEKSTRFPNMGVYLFYTSYVLTHFMGSNRRMLAIGFVCLGFLFMLRPARLRHRWWRWAAPFTLAASVHRTSLLALPGLVVSRRAWPAMAVIPGLLLCVGLGMSGAPFAALEALGSLLSNFAHITVVDKLLFYTSGGGEAQVAGELDVMRQALLGVAKRSTVLAIFIIYMAKGEVDEYERRLYNIYVTGCAIYFLMIGSPVFQVVSTYYTIVEIVLVPILFSKTPQFKVLYTLYLLLVPLGLMISALTPFMELYVPYRSIYTTY